MYTSGRTENSERTPAELSKTGTIAKVAISIEQVIL